MGSTFFLFLLLKQRHQTTCRQSVGRLSDDCQTILQPTPVDLPFFQLDTADHALSSCCRNQELGACSNSEL